MDIQSQLDRMFRPFWRRLAGMVLRGVVLEVTDSLGKSQLLKVQVGGPGEVLSAVEMIQNYGFTSNPPAGAQAVILCRGGQGGAPLAVAVDNASSRPQMGQGEAAAWTIHGNVIKLNEDGSITLTPAAGQKITLDGDVDVNGTLAASVDVTAGFPVPVSLKLHVHPGGTGPGGLTGVPQ